MLPPFPSKIPLAQLPTPLRPLDRISRELGGPRIWLKNDDMTGSLLSGNKVRKLEYVIAKAMGEGCDTLVTCGGLQSNHCRATAIAGAQLGLKVHLVLRGEQASSADGNLLLDKLAGAKVSIYSQKEYTSRLPLILEELKQQYKEKGSRAWVIPTGASDGYGLWGYLSASKELSQDFKRQKIEPELVVCATGSGGTQAGLTLGFALQNSPIKVLGMAVCDSEEYFANKASEDIAQWAALLPKSYAASHQDVIRGARINTNANYIGPGYAITYDEVSETIRWLAREEGVVLDPVYTGKAFYGLVSEIKSGNFAHYKDIVFVHTGGIFGLFPYRNDLSGG